MIFLNSSFNIVEKKVSSSLFLSGWLALPFAIFLSLPLSLPPPPFPSSYVADYLIAFSAA